MANPPNKMIDSLIECGKAVASLHSAAKTQPNEEKLKTIHDKVKTSIPLILNDFQHVQLPPVFLENALPKILDKIQATLGKLKELDTKNASYYEQLVKDANECKSRVFTSSSSGLPRHSESPIGDSIQLEVSTPDNPQRDEVEKGKSIVNGSLTRSVSSSSALQHHSQSPTAYSTKLERFRKYKSTVNTSSVGSSGLPRHNETATGGDSTQFEGSTAENPLRDHFNGLTAREKKRLFCFCLFSPEVEVKKREPIHLWVALDLVADFLEGAKKLAKLVDDGYIECSTQDKLYCNGYKMNQFVRSMVMSAMNINFADNVDLGRRAFSVMDQKRPQQQQQQQPSHQQQQQQPAPPSPRPNKLPKSQSFDGNVRDLGTMVLNISEEDTLQATTLEKIFRMKNNIKVLHLGSWEHNPDKYIVVEVETLKGMIKNVGEVTLLSLEGMSGIVELPNSIYKLEKLKVLDLRGCPNLESLSEGIHSLKRLTHLDLSECYLLGHIPKGIASLTELRVLKGFVIDPEDSQVTGNEDASLSASFTDLRVLVKLKKLSIRTRRNFPTSDDFDTLCAMTELEILKISWLWNSSNDLNEVAQGRFPASLTKLELQATPKNTMSRLLRLISKDTQSCLEKLYIRGGRIGEFDVQMESDVQTVRLRYLANLHLDWDEFRTIFPKVTRLEVLQCPNLVFFPCDNNGIWRKFQPTNMVHKLCFQQIH